MQIEVYSSSSNSIYEVGNIRAMDWNQNGGVTFRGFPLLEIVYSDEDAAEQVIN